jgi:hypothetical protein
MSIFSSLKSLVFGGQKAKFSQSDIGVEPSRTDEIISVQLEARQYVTGKREADVIQGFFRVISESIAIARQSKNIETKVLRLNVARNALQEARKQADQLALDVAGFDEAESEIIRIERAIEAGTPTEIPGMVDMNENAAYSSIARDLLKEATELKRAKKYNEACDKLREAYSAEGSEHFMIEERLRLPMYLQLAGRGDEGWDTLNQLFAKYTDQFSQPRIAHQMKVFLRKENNEAASNPVRVFLHGNLSQTEAGSNLNGESVRESVSGQSSAKTISDLQREPLSAWGNDDIIKGLSFFATPQLRTPLRVLLRHDELHTNREAEPPEIAHEAWEGIWLPKVNPEYDLTGGRVGECASDVGPVRAKDYLPFLVAIRKEVEAHNSIEHRIEQLRGIRIEKGWQTYLGKHGGIEGIISRFFPDFISTVPGITRETNEKLHALGLNTPNRLSDTADEALLAIKGIGPSKLLKIRAYCAGITENRDAERVDTVIR